MDKEISGENTILVMNEDTYDAVKDELFEIACEEQDPIGHILQFCELDIIIDNNISFGITELWDEKQYNDYKSGN